MQYIKYVEKQINVKCSYEWNSMGWEGCNGVWWLRGAMEGGLDRKRSHPETYESLWGNLDTGRNMPNFIKCIS